MNPSVSADAGRTPACTFASMKSSKCAFERCRIAPPAPWATAVPVEEMLPTREIAAPVATSCPSR